MGKRRKHIIGLIVIVSLHITLKINVVAQAVDFKGNVKEVRHDYGHTDFNKVEITSKFIADSYYQDIRSKFYRAKQKLTKQKSRRYTYGIGEEKSFFVRDLLSLSGQKWYSEIFVKTYNRNGISLWIEKSANDALSKSNDLEKILNGFDSYLHEGTPRLSVDSSKGIIEILEEYVGEFPNVDGDGELDVLLLDIHDEFQQTGSYVAGFFDPVNLFEFEYSNFRDIVYLDLFPTLLYDGEIYLERALSTFAHESQHLIHAGYEGNTPELVFVNEGYSEAVEIICGFEPRSTDAFQKSPYRKLTSWNYDNPLPDYSRASLWTHYLIEQLGALSLKEFVQNQEVGIKGYQSVIEAESELVFEEVFQNWGLALLLNDNNQNPTLGYKHELRQNQFLETAIKFQTLPGVLSGQLPQLVNLPLHYSLAKKLDFSTGQEFQNNVWLSSISSYPGTDEKEVKKLRSSSIKVESTDAEFGSIDIIVSNFGEEQSSDISSFSLLGDGSLSGIELQWSYGDFTPDIFFQNASYLMLDGINEKLAVIIPPEESTYWLKQIKLWTLFKSELEGSGVDGDTERDFEILIYNVKGDKPDKPITKPVNIEVKREAGRLVEEAFSFFELYDDLSDVQDTLMVILSNDSDDENFIAFGLDRGNENATFYSKESDLQYGWESLSNHEIGGKSLNNWNPAIEVGVVLPEVKIQEISSINDVEYSFDNVKIYVQPVFHFDTTSIKMVAHMPDGSFRAGDLTALTTDEAVFEFPVMVDGQYTFINSYKSQDGKTTYRDEMEWSIDIPNGFILGNNYPNPFNPTTNVPFTLIEKAIVGWEVTDVLGRKVKSVPLRVFEAGSHSQKITLNGLASGVYFVQAVLKRERSNVTKKFTGRMMLIK
ncbi:T9SS type A sorting domain-containing protein [Gracilimonas sediminicola]|uniref:T9SS type A sorting domain-containing protein n=1 Tax=Gracilimonas sediminicola TaxID=2952158 RepID=A0A9X2RHW5_9BACT|nr:T9SS type A sorting domain-containing protein [Gracilimonas sediminicola]MCP9292259.1 T9SS type A sorting domain-containing protein [Gracilimonas sediminicola]